MVRRSYRIRPGQKTLIERYVEANPNALQEPRRPRIAEPEVRQLPAPGDGARSDDEGKQEDDDMDVEPESWDFDDDPPESKSLSNLLCTDHV